MSQAVHDAAGLEAKETTPGTSAHKTMIGLDNMPG